jgi:hypothetical protein
LALEDATKRDSINAYTPNAAAAGKAAAPAYRHAAGRAADDAAGSSARHAAATIAR